MNARTIRTIALAAFLFAITLSILGWFAFRVVVWARDLPNRIVIDGDAIGNSIGQAVTESYHLALRDGDVATKLQVLNEFAPLIRQNKDGAAWIRSEYLEDIVVLVESEDPKVSEAASDIVALLDADTPTSLDTKE